MTTTSNDTSAPGPRVTVTAPRPAAPAATPPAEVTVVVPTFNEAGNVAELLRRIDAVAAEAGVAEVLFVDDSTDDTPDVIATLAAQRERRAGVDVDLTGGADPLVPSGAARRPAPVRVGLLHRPPGERTGGLSGAVAVGLARADTAWVLVMDGDLQHPPETIPRMLRAAEGKDLVIASRYTEGGTAAGLDGARRRLVSTGATWLARAAFPRRLGAVTDTMTGFFLVRRAALDLDRLRPDGFKILLELLCRHDLRVEEVPFRFGERHSGASKASLSQGVRFLGQVTRLRAHHWLTPLRRMARFGAVGVACLVLDVALFNALLPFDKVLTAKLIAATVAIAASYLLNRRWTWRDRPPATRRPGLRFALVSLGGIAAAELCLLVSHYALGLTSPLADNLSANGVGLALGMVWRYVGYDRWVFGSSS